VNRPEAATRSERGAYLVNTLGHCGECHTPRTSSFAMDLKQSLAGNVIEGAYAPDLRPKAMAERGWSERDLLQFLRTGLSPQGVMTMGMFPVLQHSSAHMEEADLKAMAAYLMQGEKPESRLAAEAPRDPDLGQWRAHLPRSVRRLPRSMARASRIPRCASTPTPRPCSPRR
jgi:mono/diheme cytochrome c family protein